MVTTVMMQGSRHPIRGAKRFIAHPRSAVLSCRGGGAKRELVYVESLRVEGRPTSIFSSRSRAKHFLGQPWQYYPQGIQQQHVTDRRQYVEA
jgi:hypothetical protein